ncbi:MAG: UvrB/UvrC motif-containing protein [Lentisphaeria bacterium]|nr:UvrB/UvrC motif-containing protein [Lentisphaeria bacterium]
MLCQNCHKKEATIHVQQIVDGHIHSIHLCEECAAKKNGEVPELQDFNLAEVLFDIAGKVAHAVKQPLEGPDGSAPAPADAEEPVSTCPSCGRTAQQFRKTGYLGCPECYKTFAPQISGMLKNLHRGERHLGKVPLSADAQERKGRDSALLNREIERLRRELEEKIRQEAYEDAAVLRDRIQELSRKMRENEGEA